MAILLPHTSYKDASLLADEIIAANSADESQFQCSVLTYPHQWLNSELHENNKKALYAKLDGWAHAHDSLIRLLKSSKKIPAWKRLIDIMGSGIGILMLLPVFIILSAFIKIVSPGNVLFRQKRIGFLGKQFICYKFRTTHENSGTGVHNNYFSTLISNDVPMMKLDAHDPRIIPFGTILRKIGLDELPQLFNVFKGDMSLIGPRPCIAYEAEAYKPWHKRRFDVTPGLTGLWQVSGKNRTTFNQMMRYDISYALKRNYFLDIKILFKTAPAIIKQFYEKSNVDLSIILAE